MVDCGHEFLSSCTADYQLWIWKVLSPLWRWDSCWEWWQGVRRLLGSGTYGQLKDAPHKVIGITYENLVGGGQAVAAVLCLGCEGDWID